jgi:hypothetical protein
MCHGGVVCTAVYPANASSNAFASLVDQVQEAGTYQITCNAARLARGVSFYWLRTGRCEQTENMLLLP